MEKDKLNIRIKQNAIILEKDENKVSIVKAVDDDIWFEAQGDICNISFNLFTRDNDEYIVYTIFADLMKSIVGKYILLDDRYSTLPEDFINLDEKTIIWHSDNFDDNILKLEYCKDGNIDEKVNITIIKDDKASYNRIRIRTNGSDYGTYYQEFLTFYDKLQNKLSNLDCVRENDNNKAKKKSFKRIFNHN